MRKNRLRELLNQGKPTMGTRVLTPWAGMMEVIGHSNAFDYIEYLGEYSPFNLDLFDNIGRAIDMFPNMSSMIKVEEANRPFITTRAIDAGIQNVLFTDCRNADEVRESIRLVRAETPEDGGIHGCGMRRSVGYVMEVCSEAWVKSLREVVVAIMIEKKSAMDNLDEILSVEGLDMVQFGPGDYSISDGRPGQARTPETKQVEREMIKMALKKGVAPRVEIASFEQAKPYWDMGVRHFCIGVDVRTIHAWCLNQAEGIRKLLG